MLYSEDTLRVTSKVISLAHNSKKSQKSITSKSIRSMFDAVNYHFNKLSSMNLWPNFCVLYDSIDDSSNEIEHSRLHEEFVVLFCWVIFFDVYVSFLVVIVPPKYKSLIFLELNEWNAADMQIVVIAVPKPLSTFQNISLKKV